MQIMINMARTVVDCTKVVPKFKANTLGLEVNLSESHSPRKQRGPYIAPRNRVFQLSLTSSNLENGTIGDNLSKLTGRGGGKLTDRAANQSENLNDVNQTVQAVESRDNARALIKSRKCAGLYEAKSHSLTVIERIALVIPPRIEFRFFQAEGIALLV